MRLTTVEVGDFIGLIEYATIPFNKLFDYDSIYEVIYIGDGYLEVRIDNGTTTRIPNMGYNNFFEVKKKGKSMKQKELTVNVHDNVNHPAHYTQGGIECIDAMEAAYGTEAVIIFCMCNAYKYIWRNQKKNGTEDIKKCQWYLNKMMELQNKLKKNDSTK